VLFGNPKHFVHTKGPISFHVAMSRSILMLAEMVVKILFREEKKAVLSTLIVPIKGVPASRARSVASDSLVADKGGVVKERVDASALDLQLASS
jgi:hypothetical protein